MSLCLLQARVNGTSHSISSIESTTQPFSSTQACICIPSLRFKCPILCRHANVTQGTFLLIFLAAHVTNIWHFPWANILHESYCGVDDQPASILKDLGSNLCQNTCYSAAFLFPSDVFFYFFFKLNMKIVLPFYAQKKLLLTLNLLTWRIRWAPNNASKWQVGFNSAFK